MPGRRLRVVQLGKYYPPSAGGIETHTHTLCHALAARGHEVEAVVVNHAPRSGRDATFERWARTADSVERDGPVTVTRAGRVANLAKLDVTPTLLNHLRQRLRNPPDLWHLHTPNITMMLAALALRGVRPLVITHHSDIVRQRVGKYAVRPLERLLYRRAARVLSDSPPYIGGSDLLTSLVRARPGLVTSLPLGIDTAPYREPSEGAKREAERLRATEGGPIWLSVGRLVYYKALGVGLRALKQLPGVWHVVGTGPMQAAWRAEAEALGVADRVVWRGRVNSDELVGAYLAAAAHWFPSNARSEGFGLVQVEAMAAGCPTVNCAIGHSGVPWVCRHDESGLTVPPDDPAAFAHAARRLVNEPALRERLSRGGRADAEARFSAPAMAARCEALYYEALGLPAPGGPA